jgi:hypothetical protein
VAAIPGNPFNGGVILYDLALNVDSWDLVFHNNDLLLIDNAERIGQQIKITLQFWFKEWFLDTTQGIPYLEHICVKNPNLQHIRQIFREAIMSVDGVDSVTELTLSVNAKERILSVNYTANTSAGLLTRRELLGYG